MIVWKGLKTCGHLPSIAPMELALPSCMLVTSCNLVDRSEDNEPHQKIVNDFCSTVIIVTLDLANDSCSSNGNDLY